MLKDSDWKTWRVASDSFHSQMPLPATRYSSIFHRRQAIVEYSKHKDTFETYQNLSVYTYTVQGQGLAPLALGSARPDPNRARARARCQCLGPALIGSRAKTFDLARP